MLAGLQPNASRAPRHAYITSCLYSIAGSLSAYKGESKKKSKRKTR